MVLDRFTHVSGEEEEGKKGKEKGVTSCPTSKPARAGNEVSSKRPLTKCRVPANARAKAGSDTPRFREGEGEGKTTSRPTTGSLNAQAKSEPPDEKSGLKRV